MAELEHSASFAVSNGKASEIYPKSPTVFEADVRGPPFMPIWGEDVKVVGRTTTGTIAVSNYRLFISFDDSDVFLNIAMGAIDFVESREPVVLDINCKDGRLAKCSFETYERCQDWLRRISQAIFPPKTNEERFAFAFYAWAIDEGDCRILKQLTSKRRTITFFDEVQRLQFNLHGPWRICHINEGYKFCSSYPPQFLVPGCITDEDLEVMATFRVQRRLPIVVWRHPVNGAVIARSSQPVVGWLGYTRCKQDEKNIFAIRAACALDSLSPEPTNDASARKMLIIDARSQIAAYTNRGVGGGFEWYEYYEGCEVQFMSLPNIHGVRKVFQALRLGDTVNWFKHDGKDWTIILAQLLYAATTVANAIQNEARPVLVHCSDGWDRTPQIVSLAQILLDPYYRTIEGFQVLVQREWLESGHKFGDRCGTIAGSEQQNERSPIFLQWLDTVHQLLLQFPCSFEYSELFLIKLVQHTYSNLFGNFLGNSPRQRVLLKIAEHTFSVWALLEDVKYRNWLYVETAEVLKPSYDVRDQVFWSQVFTPPQSQPPSTDAEKSSLNGASNGYGIENVISNGNGSILVPSLTSKTEDTDYVQAKLTEEETLTKEVKTEPESCQVEPQETVENGESMLGSSPSRREPRLIARQYFYNSSENQSRPEPRERTLSATLYERFVGPLEDSSLEPLESISDVQSSESAGAVDDISFPDSNESNTIGDLMNDHFPNLDIDGMESVMDTVQKRLSVMLADHSSKLFTLQRELQVTRMQFLRIRDSRPLALCVNDSSPLSINSCLSWENVEGHDLQTTLWVPDHAVSTCKGCNCKFWIGRRKHHCRKCGNIFCSNCSEHTAILPGEDLYYPVRVCNSCRNQLNACVCCRAQRSRERLNQAEPEFQSNTSEIIDPSVNSEILTNVPANNDVVPECDKITEPSRIEKIGCGTQVHSEELLKNETDFIHISQQDSK